MLVGVEGRNELRRSAPRTPAIRRGFGTTAQLLRRAAHGEARYHRLGAEQLSLRRGDRGQPAEARIRPLLRQELFAVPRLADHPPDDPRRAVAGRRALVRWPRRSSCGATRLL